MPKSVIYNGSGPGERGPDWQGAVNEQAAIWEQPKADVDPRPLETGGALVILRLTPEEAVWLLSRNALLMEAIHDLIADGLEDAR